MVRKEGRLDDDVGRYEGTALKDSGTGMGAFIWGGGCTYSQAGTATVSLHGERKWALEKGGGRVQAPKLISCRSQTQPQGRNNVCVCVFVCDSVCEEETESKRVQSEFRGAHNGRRREERQKKRGADLHQRDWICMRKSMMLFCC